MRVRVDKGKPARKVSASTTSSPLISDKSLAIHGESVSPTGNDLHVRIAKRAYEIHAERGYLQGHALDDWLDAEREVLKHQA
ncbi:conserved protein of unknown function [Nitrospira japonica]|uniref:DUF2934 domain-containing protein n=1 Tax=Nitrospira japonica TaxID=1325564 RepID=A0A1W1I2P3_9BACT|nr:DUF2934 domain-containing protein [Nitrospira japonica]SLM47262.1 conserved protein of unknown function [Nitrospira japonica]